MVSMSEYKPELRDDWAVGFYKNANDAWENIYYGLNRNGNITSPRGLKIKESLGCNIYILNPNDNLVYNSFRGLSPRYLSKEYQWYKSGSRRVEDAIKLSKFWKTIANPDGTVNSNYGAYIFVSTNDGKSVWDKTVDILRNDNDTRQAIIQIPIMPARGSKDTPCTSSLQFFIRDNKLFCTVYMRSTDIILGFPIDIFQFTMWQLEMAKELGIECGWIRFISGNIHCYEKHWIENVSGLDREFKYEDLYIDNSNYLSYCSTKKSYLTAHTDLWYEDFLSLKDKNYIPKDPLLKYMDDNKIIWR